MDCIFCKIVRGEIPSQKVFEDDVAFAFLDIAPVNAGHTLVVPKEHFESIDDMSEAQAAALFARVHRLAPAIRGAVGAPAWNLGLNTGAVAGQVVMHAHLHIMPRFEGDGLKLWPKRDIPEAEMRQIAADVAAAVAGLK